ncbi:hypothetical protein FQ087_22150 [Sporosarcina sp. ANT_H38]|uniref:hypothetical protein n=1 Tax=unclassified Sporosarcina TaxID=2647733 RepID=UPI0011F2BACB|nr:MULTISPECIES: hypothetical protein [unclassified Sporosarcina]KAA0940019.1 hypothetical protein FQ087_22150 [Sporosarcina sp. ANT_H38]
MESTVSRDIDIVDQYLKSDSFSSALFSSKLANFVERFVEGIDTAVINEFPIIECPMIVADF